MALPAVTMRRVEAVLKDEDLEFDLVLDRYICLHFINSYFLFELVEDPNLFRIYGYWCATTTDAEIISGLKKFVNGKNRELYLPKLRTTDADDDGFRVGYEYCVPVTTGLTDEQLHDVVFAALTSSRQVLEELEVQFPQLVTWPAEEADVLDEAKEQQ